jgi:hypothetical protein
MTAEENCTRKMRQGADNRRRELWREGMAQIPQNMLVATMSDAFIQKNREYQLRKIILSSSICSRLIKFMQGS